MDLRLLGGQWQVQALFDAVRELVAHQGPVPPEHDGGKTAAEFR